MLYRRVAALFAATLLLVGMSSGIARTAPEPTREEGSPSWQQRMQRLATVLSRLLPELVARDGNAKALEKDAKELAELSHALSANSEGRFGVPPDADPSLELFAERLDLDVRRGQEALRLGDIDYAKQLLKRATSHCIACHTRGEGRAGLPSLNFEPRLASLRPVERAELLAATSQLDRALDEYRKILATDASASWLEWDRALRHALAIAVRVERSPQLAGEIVELVRAQPQLPESMKRNARLWKESIDRWRAEEPRRDESEAALASEMERLYEQAQRLQDYPADRAAEILYLRASAAAHELLARGAEGEHAARAIRVLGTAYDALNDPSSRAVHEAFFEMCIRKVPHTQLAEECYRRYEDAIYFGYSGSGGTFIPPEVARSLAELKRLARAESTSTGESARRPRSQGELLFGIHCASCHGESGRGDGPMAELLTVQPSNLRQIRARHGGVFPEAELERVIDGRTPVRGHGTQEMPLFGIAFQQVGLDADQEAEVRERIRALIAYLAMLQEAGPAADRSSAP